MSPNLILVMRHAEKPTDDSDPNLSPPGKERAERLATYIPATFGKPDVVIAAAVSKHSARPLETIQPLADALGLKPKTPFADAQYAELAQRLLSDANYANKLIVVCWHHGEIPSLMQALGAKAGDYPSRWDANVFNLILKTGFAADGTVSVVQVEEPF